MNRTMIEKAMMRSCLISVVLSTATLLSSAQAADDDTSAVRGAWSGTYVCGFARDNRIALELDGVTAKEITGVVRFTISQPRSVSGSYRVRGAFVPQSRQIRLAPAEWIERPAGVQASALTGTLHESGRSLRGAVLACAGDQAFSMTKEIAAHQAAAQPEPVKPRSGGPLEGRWSGQLTCGTLNEIVPIDLSIAQDGDSFIALASIERTIVSRRKTESAPGRAIFSAEGKPEAGLRFSDPSLIDGHMFTGMSLASDDAATLKAEIVGMAGVNSCAPARLRRATGPAFPSIPRDFAGVWAGPFHHGDTVVAVESQGAALAAEWRMSTPRNKPAAQQDHFVAPLVPVLQRGGEIVFAPLAARRAEGVFKSGALYYLRYLSVVSLRQDGHGKVAMGTYTSGRWQAGQSDMSASLERVDVATARALSAGASPKAPLPAAIGGKLAEAPTLDAQCDVLKTWATPYTSQLGAQRRETPRRQFLSALPIFSDDAFEPVFGLSYSLTDQPTRFAIARLLQENCSRRFQMRELDTTIFQTAFRLDTGGGGFNEITAAVVDRNSTAKAVGDLKAQLASLDETTQSLGKLDEIERAARPLFADLTSEEEAAFTKTLGETREKVATALLEREAQTIASAPAQAGLDERASAFAANLSAARVPDSTKGRLLEAIKPNVSASLVAAIDGAGASAPSTGLEALRELRTVLVQKTAQVDRLPPALRAPEAREALARLRTRHLAVANDPETARAFARMLADVAPRDDPEAALRATALRYVAPEDLQSGSSRLPNYPALYREALTKIELRSVEATDRSVSHAEGEPSMDEMVAVFQAYFRNVNAELAAKIGFCNRRGYGNDPLAAMECLSILATSGGTSRLRFEMARFEKIGCEKAASEAGYVCDYRIAMRTTSPVMQNNSLERILGRGGAGKARFVRTSGGWTALF